VNYIDPNGHDYEWIYGLCWGIAATIILIAALGVIYYSGGSAIIALNAIMNASVGIASSTAQLTAASYMFVGASMAFVGASMMASRSGNMLESGPSVLFSTFTAGAFGMYSGNFSWNQQMKGLDHSFTTERRRFWKSEANNPNSQFYGNERAIKGLAPDGYVLHHPYGRYGSKIGIYELVTVTQHKQIHATYGYGQRTCGFNNYYKFDNIWEWFRMIL
jgi:hypothetical protein